MSSNVAILFFLVVADVYTTKRIYLLVYFMIYNSVSDPDSIRSVDPYLKPEYRNPDPDPDTGGQKKTH